MERFYYGAYEGWSLNHNYNTSNYIQDGKIRSLSGCTPAYNLSLNTSCIYCKANGDNYNVESYTKRWYLLGLGMLVIKGRDIQSNIGTGFYNNTYGEYRNLITRSGTRNNNGLFYGKNKSGPNIAGYYNSDAAKYFGIENFWGNLWNFVNGIGISKSGQTPLFYIKSTAPYDNIFTDGIPQNIRISSSINGTTDMVPMKNEILLPLTAQADKTKGRCDGWQIYDATIEELLSSTRQVILIVGGWLSDAGSPIGPFSVYLKYLPSTQIAIAVPRLISA